MLPFVFSLALPLLAGVYPPTPIFQDGILRNRMGAAAARSGAPCVPTATPGPWDIPPAIGDAWFIHYPIYTGCVAARLETRSAAQRANHKTDQKTAVATPAL